MTLTAKQLDLVYHTIATGSSAARMFGVENPALDSDIQKWMQTGERNEALEIALVPIATKIISDIQEAVAIIKRYGFKP